MAPRIQALQLVLIAKHPTDIQDIHGENIDRHSVYVCVNHSILDVRLNIS